MAAFCAPDLPMATVATGTPPGICTVDSSASSPCRDEEGRGTPITGRVVCAATTPARCAACPAPRMATPKPFSSSPAAMRAVSCGVRWALVTSISNGMPKAWSVRVASSITGRSESLPMATQTLSPVRPLDGGSGSGLAELLDGSGRAEVLELSFERRATFCLLEKGRIVTEADELPGGLALGGGAERLFALAALEEAVAGEAVAVVGEEIGHLLLPGVDEADLLVVGHRAHADEQADVLARLVIGAQQIEDAAGVSGRCVHPGRLPPVV